MIKKMNYLPVGLGDNKFSNDWYRDDTRENISNKNKSYGEYTFHYWLWKNYLNQFNNNWIGFCQYRKFWVNDGINNQNLTFEEFNKKLLKFIPDQYEKYESILGEPLVVNKFRLSKFIKRNFKKMILNPSLLYNKKKRNLKFHFDLWHGDGNLDKAIKCLKEKDIIPFTNFMNKNVSFNPHNMFVCKSKEILKSYYEDIFPWLERCENEFKSYDLTGYGLQRIYGFLAERYMSYWFQKNTKYKTLPIFFKDISIY